MGTNTASTHAEIDKAVGDVLGGIYGAQAYFMATQRLDEEQPAAGDTQPGRGRDSAIESSLELLSRSGIAEGAAVRLAMGVPISAYCLDCAPGLEGPRVTADMTDSLDRLVETAVDLQFAGLEGTARIAARFTRRRPQGAEGYKWAGWPGLGLRRSYAERGGLFPFALILAQSTGMENRWSSLCGPEQAELLADPVRRLAAALNERALEQDDPPSVAVVRRGMTAAARAARILADSDQPAYRAGFMSRKPVKAAMPYLRDAASATGAVRGTGTADGCGLQVLLHFSAVGRNCHIIDPLIAQSGQVSYSLPSGVFDELERPDYWRTWHRRLLKDVAPLADGGADKATLDSVYSVLLFALMAADQSPCVLAALAQRAEALYCFARHRYRTKIALGTLMPLEWLA